MSHKEIFESLLLNAKKRYFSFLLCLLLLPLLLHSNYIRSTRTGFPSLYNGFYVTGSSLSRSLFLFFLLFSFLSIFSFSVCNLRVPIIHMFLFQTRSTRLGRFRFRVFSGKIRRFKNLGFVCLVVI